jgi:outer membrane protein OmpA-like peptidoglycan-associated protein
MKTVRWLWAATATLTLASFARDARAQAQGFAVDAFDPSERGSDWFSVESLDLRGNVRPAIGVVMDGAYRPLVIDSDGKLEESVIRNQIVGNVGASLVLWNRLRLGLNLPVAVFQDGHQDVIGGVTYAPPKSPSVGDLRLGTDLRLAGTYGDPFTLAIGARVYVPTGQRDNYTGDGSVRVDGRLEAAGDLGAFTYAARVGAEYRGLDDTLAGNPLGSQVLFGAAMGLRLANRAFVIGPEVYGSTNVSAGGAFFAKTSTPVDGILGAHLTFLRNFRIGAGGGTGLTRGLGSPEARWLASLEWVPAYEEPAPPPPPLDRDRDGIIDEDDACPDVAGVRTGDPKTNGCPPDRDKDSIVDAEDACPDVAGIRTDDPKTNGCPSDRDKDGIIDAEDACPDVAGVKTDDPKTNGCPSDRDKDGIVDDDDACPDVAGIKTNDPRTNGCPDPDRDKDGIVNESDACPDVPGPKNPDPKKNGCPQAYIQAGQIKIREQVKFATASSAVVSGKDSEDVLQAVKAILVEHPEIKLRIEGHTDNVAGPALNRPLSKHRAESVEKWLIKHGIDAARLQTQGFGPDRPIDTNKTPEGRRNNRRVEFHILDDNGAPESP